MKQGEEVRKCGYRNNESCLAQHMDVLSRIMIRSYCSDLRDMADSEKGSWDADEIRRDLVYVAGLDEWELGKFGALANTNHVIVRALTALQIAAERHGEKRIAGWCERALADERLRIARDIDCLHAICSALDSRGCKVAVIKSLDHWPDFGSDIDLCTSADEARIKQVMEEEFNARPVERSWGDRLANKWNYCVPGLPELVEIHVQYLGQTGEHTELVQRVIRRAVPKSINGHIFYVPAVEERIIISTLQRVYRHFYYRLCDMVDFAPILQAGAVNFFELARASSWAGICPGVATFLSLLRNYLKCYGVNVPIPEEVLAAAFGRDSHVEYKNGFLRVSKATALHLYTAQLMQAGRRRDGRALLRLPLLPPLAASAVIAHSLSGSDKGIW
ncbi:MAG: hypothetical protein WBS24_11575 [Terriglobales bacterium]